MEENWQVDLFTEYKRRKSQNRTKKIVLIGIRNLGRNNYWEMFRKKSDFSFISVELREMVGHLRELTFGYMEK